MNHRSMPRPAALRLCLLSAALWATATASRMVAADAPIAFSGLGDFAGGEFWSAARAISADGSTIVGEGATEANRQAFRWTASGGLGNIGALPGGSGDSVALAVSADGSVVVGQSTSGTWIMGEGFRWASAGGMVGLGVPAGAESSVASAVSQDGGIVAGSFSILSDSHAFRWSGTDGFAPLNFASGDGEMSGAFALTPSATIVGGFSTTPVGSQATLWTPGGRTVLGVLATSGGNSSVTGLSESGGVAVGWSQSDNGLEAFRWVEGIGMSVMGTVPNGLFFSQANGVSADGNVVVGRASGPDGMEAFLWTAEAGMVSLAQYLVQNGVDLAGWSLTEAVGISADGLVIAGNGFNPAGDGEGWVVNLRGPDEGPGEGDGGGDEGGEVDDPVIVCPDGHHSHAGKHCCRRDWKHVFKRAEHHRERFAALVRKISEHFEAIAEKRKRRRIEPPQRDKRRGRC